MCYVFIPFFYFVDFVVCVLMLSLHVVELLMKQRSFGFIPVAFNSERMLNEHEHRKRANNVAGSTELKDTNKSDILPPITSVCVCALRGVRRV